MTTITLRTDRDGERSDAFLARSVPDLTRSAAQKLLEQGMVKRRGAPLKKKRPPQRRGGAGAHPPRPRASGRGGPEHPPGRGL